MGVLQKCEDEEAERPDSGSSSSHQPHRARSKVGGTISEKALALTSDEPSGGFGVGFWAGALG